MWRRIVMTLERRGGAIPAAPTPLTLLVPAIVTEEDDVTHHPTPDPTPAPPDLTLVLTVAPTPDRAVPTPDHIRDQPRDLIHQAGPDLKAQIEKTPMAGALVEMKKGQASEPYTLQEGTPLLLPRGKRRKRKSHGGQSSIKRTRYKRLLKRKRQKLKFLKKLKLLKMPVKKQLKQKKLMNPYQ
uniref:Uncharacterized protein n=1 Tax=Ciona intestinalis TaxID=7719 RepID=H2XR87_CIOIN